MGTVGRGQSSCPGKESDSEATMSSGTETSGGSSLGVTRTSDKYLGFPEYEGDLRHEQLGPTQV